MIFGDSKQELKRLPFPKEKDKVLYQGTAAPFSVM
jgi:hypothetical protein